MSASYIKRIKVTKQMRKWDLLATDEHHLLAHKILCAPMAKECYAPD